MAPPAAVGGEEGKLPSSSSGVAAAGVAAAAAAESHSTASAGGGGSVGGSSSSVGSLPDVHSPPRASSLSILDRIYHRTVAPTDLPRCYTIESDSYPADESASLEALQYRQHHAAQYFRCAVVLPPSSVDNPTDSMKMTGEIVGFVTGTRCSAFDVDSMTVHDPNGSMLAIHSVVVAERHRNQGVGGAMMREYVQSIRKMNVKTPIDKIVLIAKADKLAFYVRAGFAVVGISPIVHGRDVWYECCCDLTGGSGLLPRGGGGSGASSSGASIAITGTGTVGGVGGVAGNGSQADSSSVRGAVDGAGSGAPLGQSARDLVGGVGAGGGGGANGSNSNSVGDLVVTGSVPASPWDSLLAGGAGAGGGPRMAAAGGGKPCFVIDSFADPARPGSGNPAAVVYMGEAGSIDSVGEREEAWMRTVAREFNLSETAFLWDRRRGDGASSALWRGDEVGYDIRYYTKSGAEVDLCGHATLAAASVVLRVAAEDTSRPTKVKGAVFYAKKDVLKASSVPVEDGSSVSSLSSLSPPSLRIVMDFPWRSVREVDAQADREAVMDMIQSAFGFGGDASTNGDILFVGIDSVGEDLLIELSPDAFDRVGPAGSSVLNVPALNCWGGGYTRGVILCCRIAKGSKDDSEDFLSRFFGPKAGIDEDPVTGSAHCTLGPYFGAKIGRSRVVGRQASSRGGIVECTLRDGGGEGEGRPRRVGIAGTAVTTVSGILFI
mmetsp:Transcript_17562/g.38415  ORF Transcript_17562/g.38415 Transcript_17562/m.38415 type:complete len:719 (+) Transcript_17562:283-2439(+)